MKHPIHLLIDEIADARIANDIDELRALTDRIEKKYAEISALLRQFDKKYGTESDEAYEMLGELRALTAINKEYIEEFIKEMEA